MPRLTRGVAQPGSASGLGPEGRKFESCLPDHFLHPVLDRENGHQLVIILLRDNNIILCAIFLCV
jgi:hypothetical protein